LIMDRNGKILADNQPAYSLTLDRSALKALLKAEPSHRPKLIAFLATVLGVPPQEIEARFEKGKLIPIARPMPLADDLAMAQLASIQAEAISFPELNVDPVQRRNYPYGIM